MEKLSSRLQSPTIRATQSATVDAAAPARVIAGESPVMAEEMEAIKRQARSVTATTGMGLTRRRPLRPGSPRTSECFMIEPAKPEAVSPSDRKRTAVMAIEGVKNSTVKRQPAM